MFSWNTRYYWDMWPVELPLYHFPGQPGLQRELPLERPQQQQRLNLQYTEMPITSNDEGCFGLSFLKRCYLLSGIFIFIALLQWLIFTLLMRHQGIFLLAAFICVTLAFSSLLFLSVCFKLRSKYWFTCPFAWLFVETVAWGVVLLLPFRSVQNIMIAVSAAGAVLILCYFLGAWLPLALLPGEIALVVILILFMSASVVVITLYIVTDQLKYHAIYFVIITVSTLPMALFHAQIVHARRYWVPMEEYVSCAAIIYMHFILFCMSFYYMIWVHNWRS